ncbi:hypothetical protein DY218_22505 [Streptomyces triticagri]|uniref:Uncharacterized protein n=1 Tax=Streptomyces triticagri TaxID=2293568 RepID=A0A372M0K1_9ACTN|nr:hypothetical protein DY218_22505 [Streptomyces triticagri]
MTVVGTAVLGVPASGMPALGVAVPGLSVLGAKVLACGVVWTVDVGAAVSAPSSPPQPEADASCQGSR